MLTTNISELIFTGQAALICQVSPQTIRWWDRIGRLSAIKTVNGVRLFDRHDVERLARERESRRAVPVSDVSGS